MYWLHESSDYSQNALFIRPGSDPYHHSVQKRKSFEEMEQHSEPLHGSLLMRIGADEHGRFVSTQDCPWLAEENDGVLALRESYL